MALRYGAEYHQKKEAERLRASRPLMAGEPGPLGRYGFGGQASGAFLGVTDFFMTRELGQLEDQRKWFNEQVQTRAAESKIEGPALDYLNENFVNDSSQAGASGAVAGFFALGEDNVSRTAKRQAALKKYPELEGIIPTFGDMEEQLALNAERRREESKRIGNDAKGFIEGTGKFTGAAGAEIVQPYNIIGLGAGAGIGAGRGIVSGALRGAALEGGIVLGAETLIEQPFRRTEDRALTDGQVAGKVAGAAGFAAGMGIALPLIAKGGSAAFKKITGREPTPIEETAIQTLQDEATFEAANPIEIPAQLSGTNKLLETGDAQIDARIKALNMPHEERAQIVEQAITKGEPVPDLPDNTALIKTESIERFASDDTLTGQSILDLQVDPKTFQFKGGSDADGVIDTLRGVKKWNDFRGNVALVYEYKDGGRFIVDGHQRLGLAKRLMKEDPNADIRFRVQYMREADGYPPRDAFVEASLKNIGEGTGTALDAAKVLRVLPEGASIGLPPNSAIVQQAQGLVRLGDDAFRAVINEVVPQNYAAMIGKYIDDEALQMSAIDIFARNPPGNVEQARFMAEGIRNADADKATTLSLFGEEQVTESLFLERAKVQDAALKHLRKDKAIFSKLGREASKIEGAGNKLDRTANADLATNAQTTMGLLSKLGNTKGPVSDEITKQARRYKQGEVSAAEAGREIGAAITGEVQRAGGLGAFLNRTGGINEPPVAQAIGDEIGPIERDTETLNMFSDAVGEGAEQQNRRIGRAIETEYTPSEVSEMEIPTVKTLDNGQQVETVETIDEIVRDLEKDADFETALGDCLI